jgi:uncharacterized membrane protein
MKQYTFNTCWTFEAPLEKIWDEIHAMDEWPAWWKYVESVEKIRPGHVGEIGSIRLIKWRTALPYSLAFRSEVTAIEPFKRMEGITFGDLEGKGIWTFQSRDGMTIVQYDWMVTTTKKWMNFLAPVARPFFNWNHDKVMQAGYEGLKKKVRNGQ